jgi:O-acetyl-ADP-ribose deacetylase (regulator of RNase III)|tara:strand:+ start:7906 stop:8472 length:567 start_codon:yes stop_codon:yes gene_type:complete
LTELKHCKKIDPVKVKVGKASLEIIQGDISLQKTQAIVNAANNYLWMGSGVAGAIKKQGGQIIEDEAVKQGSIEVGDAIITSGGQLEAEVVIHAAGMDQSLVTNADIIKKVTNRCLKLSEENKLKSISFPAIGTGVGGFDVHHCANIMLNATIDFLVGSKVIEKVNFVLFDEDSFSAFNDQLKTIFSS